MYYGTTTEATNFAEDAPGIGVRLTKAILFFVPHANPDHEHLYPKVHSWALELDDQGRPQREVGLDSLGAPLFRAPDERNTGFWPDMSEKKFARAELQPISAEDFDRLWSEAAAVA